VAENRLGCGIPGIFLSLLFDPGEQLSILGTPVEQPDIEIIVDGEIVLFAWNNESIQELAEEFGETEFPEPRPCG